MELFGNKGVYIVPYNSVEIDGMMIKDNYKESIVMDRKCKNYILKFSDGRFTLPFFKILICDNLYEIIVIEVCNFKYFCEVFYEFRYFNFIYKYFYENESNLSYLAREMVGRDRRVEVNNIYFETNNTIEEDKEYNDIFSGTTKKRMEKYKEMEIKINKKLNNKIYEPMKSKANKKNNVNNKMYEPMKGKLNEKNREINNELNDQNKGIEISFFPKIYDSIHTSLNNSEFYFSKNISTQIYKLLSSNKMKLEDLKKIVCKENSEELFLKHINSLIFYGIVIYRNESLCIKY